MSWVNERYNKILEWVNKHEYENFINEDEIEKILLDTKNPKKFIVKTTATAICKSISNFKISLSASLKYIITPLIAKNIQLTKFTL